MSIAFGDKPEVNVVNVGDEISADQINAINAGVSPSAVNPFVTQSAADAIVNGQRVDIQTFGGPTTSGTFTWTKPAGAKLLTIWLMSGGGGGGGGACYASTSGRSGGAAGPAGPSSVFFEVPADEFGDTVTVTVGAGGTGAAGRTTSGNGNTGGTGQGSSFGHYRTPTVNGGGGGTTTGSSGGASGITWGGFGANSILVSISTPSGTTGNGINGTANAGRYFVFPGGGGSGSVANGTAETYGGSGSSKVIPATNVFGVNFAIAGGLGSNPLVNVNGGNGTNSTYFFLGGTGGGGGGMTSAANGAYGGNGGNGGWPSGGGGGGAAGTVGGLGSGGGGNGANGFVGVRTYF